MRHIFVRLIIVFSILLVFITSCNIINPEEQIPAYISIDDFPLFTNITTEGPSNTSITDIWISVNGTFIGVYELPAKFPVLVDGEASLFIKAGIENNGIAASRENYPFYNPYEVVVTLVPGEVLEVNPTTTYREETVFDWFENFEDPGVSIDTTSNSLVGIGDTIIGNNTVAIVKLSEETPLFDSETLERYNFPSANTTVYLELDYKNNNAFIVGLMITSLGQVLPQPVISMNPKDEWNKIYIDLTYLSATHNFSDYYSVYISAVKNDSVDNPVIMFDNLKLIHF